MKFSVEKILVWVIVYSFALSVANSISASIFQLAATITIVTLFVVDSFPKNTNCRPTSGFLRFSFDVAYYTFALALAVAICYGLYLINPKQVQLSDDSKSLPLGYVVVFFFLTGQIDSFGMMPTWWIVSKYHELFGVFCITSFFCSLFSLHHFKSAKRLLILSILGVCVSLYYFYADIWMAARE